MNSRWLGGLILLASAPLMFAVFYYTQKGFAYAPPFSPSHVIENFGELPDFHLTESSGRPLSLADLRGHVWIANFLFTHCPGQCPMVVSKLKRLQDRLRSEPALRIVSFTVDPERDTPPVLAAYADQHGADRHKWLFATGTRRELDGLSLNGFRLGDGGSPSAHSFKLVLVDSEAHLRGYYDGLDDKAVDALGDDARYLLRQLSR